MRFVRPLLQISAAFGLVLPSLAVSSVGEVRSARAPQSDTLLNSPTLTGQFSLDLAYRPGAVAASSEESLQQLHEAGLFFQSFAQKEGALTKDDFHFLSLPSPVFLNPSSPGKSNNGGLLGGLGKVSGADSFAGIEVPTTSEHADVAMLDGSIGTARFPSRTGSSHSADASALPLVPALGQSSHSTSTTLAPLATLPAEGAPLVQKSGASVSTSLSKSAAAGGTGLNRSNLVMAADTLSGSGSGSSLSQGGGGSSHGVTIGAGDVLSPGGPYLISKAAFDTTVTLGSGGVFQMTVLSTTAFGLYSDALVVTDGALKIASTPSAPFIISLYSMFPGATNGGPLTSFDFNRSYSWEFAIAPRIVDFSANAFTFDTSHFFNSTGSGMFFVSQNGNTLSINFTPVPEPSTFALLGFGLAFLGLLQWRSKRRS